MASSGIVDDMILMRTLRGQRSVLDDLQIGAAHARLLRMVNGYTSLGQLSACLGQGHDWRSAASDLLERGLVASEAPKLPDLEARTRRYVDFMRTRDALNLAAEVSVVDAEPRGRSPGRDPFADTGA